MTWEAYVSFRGI